MSTLHHSSKTPRTDLVITGEESSHSLYFELSQGWTGLLVEPLVTGLNFKARRATVSPSCLATQPRPHYAHFDWNSTALLDSETNVRAMGGIVQVSVLHSHWARSFITALSCVP